MYLLCWAGFPELNQDDQLILIKCGFFEVWLTRMARMFNKAEGCLTFEDGSIIQKEELGVVFSVSLGCSQENCWVQCCSNVWENCKAIEIITFNSIVYHICYFMYRYQLHAHTVNVPFLTFSLFLVVLKGRFNYYYYSSYLILFKTWIKMFSETWYWYFVFFFYFSRILWAVCLTWLRVWTSLI